MVAVKWLDLPSVFPDPKSPLHDYSFYSPPYTVVPASLFPYVCLAADLVTAFRLNSPAYFYYSIFTPLNISSVENMLLTLHPSPLSGLLPCLDPFLVPLPVGCNSLFIYAGDYAGGCFSSHYSHVPSLSAHWYFSTFMISQYAALSFSLLAILSFFFISRDSRLIPLFMTRSTFKNYLPFILHSRFLSSYFALYFVFTHLSHLFHSYFLVNTNFLFWSTLLFIALYLLDTLTSAPATAGGSVAGADADGSSEAAAGPCVDGRQAGDGAAALLGACLNK